MKKTLGALAFAWATTNLVSILPNSNFNELETKTISIENKEGDIFNWWELDLVHTININLSEKLGGEWNTQKVRDSFSSVSLSQFRGEIYNFTWRKQVHDFVLDFNDIPNNIGNSPWLSGLINIAYSEENSGWSYIQGQIAAVYLLNQPRDKPYFTKFTIYIFAQALSKQTPTNGHVWFMTGDALTFRGR